MTPASTDLTDDRLAEQLRDLGAHLDLGPSSGERGRADLLAAVLAALPDGADGGSESRMAGRPDARWPRLLVAAAVVVVVAIGVLAVAPAREAVARWLGIGGVRIVRVDQPLGPEPGGPVTTGDPGVTAGPGAPVDVDAEARGLPFDVRLPSLADAGEVRSARVDPAVPSGLIEVHYRDFALVELASRPGGVPVLAKTLGPGTTSTPVDVGGRPGLWISGEPHQLAFIDPAGETRLDAVRRAGDVLLWEDGGVTYRIEGAPSLERAQAIAASLR